MSLFPFLAVAFGGGALALLVRRNEAVTAIVGLAALALAAIAATSIAPEPVSTLGGASLAGTAYARLFLQLGAVVGVVLVLVGLATDHLDELAASTLLALGTCALALAAPDPLIGALAATAGGFAGLLVTVRRPATSISVAAAARGLRVVAVAGLAAVAAAAWTARPVEAVTLDPQIVGLALLGFALAVALRLGAIPLHLWAARLPDAAPELALPLVLAWAPAALVVVALGWSESVAAGLAQPLGLERVLVIAVGTLSLLLGVGAAIAHDDLEHVLAYSIVADGGIALVAVGALDGDAWAPGRAWLLAFVVTKSAFAAWVVTVRATYGTRRLRDLGGWARRSPVLAVGLVAIAAAGAGWPGFAAFDARATLGEVAVGPPLAAVLAVGGLGSLAYLGRVLVVGLGRPSAQVAAGARGVPVWPRQLRASTRTTLVLDLSVAARVNRAPIAAGLVLLLALLGVAVGSGAFGASAAAAEPPPRPVPSAAASATQAP
jgi:NADH:ubiquinone oxidoreductase subunit 2 (subunit N)